MNERGVPESWEARELSNLDALAKLGKDFARWAPREYLISLINHPAATLYGTGLITGTGGMLLGYPVEGLYVFAGAHIFPVLGASANGFQIGKNLWREYKRGNIDKVMTVGELRQIFTPKINFF